MYQLCPQPLTVQFFTVGFQNLRKINLDEF